MSFDPRKASSTQASKHPSALADKLRAVRQPSAHASSGLVYSTDSGRMCPACRQAVVACVCDIKPVPKGDGTVRVSRESKGRGGKVVTLVRGLPMDDAALQSVCKRLKTVCGSGGTVKDGTVEVQGDHVEKVAQQLVRDGHRVKLAGASRPAS